MIRNVQSVQRKGGYFIFNLDAIFNEWNHHVVETLASLVSILSDGGVETIEILTLELILGFWNLCRFGRLGIILFLLHRGLVFRDTCRTCCCGSATHFSTLGLWKQTCRQRRNLVLLYTTVAKYRKQQSEH